MPLGEIPIGVRYPRIVCLTKPHDHEKLGMTEGVSNSSVGSRCLRRSRLNPRVHNQSFSNRSRAKRSSALARIAIARQFDLKETMKSMPSIPEWFSGRHVLITGSTGFMGKVLLSKLLTSCPDVGNIYLLVREKKGVDPKSRLNSIVQQEPFRSLREETPERLKKLVVISGDTTIDDLGLSTSNKDLLLTQVSVVLHMAANVRFDLPLKTAVNLNTRGTANVLALAKQMQNLKSFIHVSTAYCQCHEEVLEERAYPTSISPENVMSLVQTTSDDLLEKMTPDLLGKQPNTYAFTKALSEDLVARCGLPSGVARPSIVVASWKEPVAGWVENMNGPTGLMVGGAKGVIRTMLCNSEYTTDLMPCDLAVNAIIALAWRVGVEQPNKPMFMNVTESSENPLTWENAIETGKKYTLKYPFSGPLWYPGGSLTSSKLYHNFVVLLFHLLPAYLLDAILLLVGQKPFLVRVHVRVNLGLELLNYYTTKQWIFRNDGLKNMQKILSPKDKEVFFMDTKAYDWDEYMRVYILGTRRFCLKDDPSTIPHARKVMGYLYVADIVVRTIAALLFAWFAYSWFNQLRLPSRTLMEINEI